MIDDKYIIVISCSKMRIDGHLEPNLLPWLQYYLAYLQCDNIELRCVCNPSENNDVMKLLLPLGDVRSYQPDGAEKKYLIDTGKRLKDAFCDADYCIAIDSSNRIETPQRYCNKSTNNASRAIAYAKTRNIPLQVIDATQLRVHPFECMYYLQITPYDKRPFPDNPRINFKEFADDRNALFQQPISKIPSKPITHTQPEGTLVSLDTIVIQDSFKKYPPRPTKMDKVRKHYQKTGFLDKAITLDGNILVDGYMRYLVAQELHLAEVPTIQYVDTDEYKINFPVRIAKVRFTKDGKEYWYRFNPNKDYVDIRAGDWVYVQGQNNWYGSNVLGQITLITETNKREALNLKQVVYKSYKQNIER